MTTSSNERTMHAHDGNNVVQFRNMFGIAQEELAKRLNITTEQMDKLEKAAHIPDPILIRIAKALDVPFDWLRNYEDGKNVYFANGAITVNDSATSNVNFRPIFYYQLERKEEKPYASSLNEDPPAEKAVAARKRLQNKSK